MKKDSYTLNQIATNRIPIGGKPRTYRYLQRIIKDAGISPDGVSNHGSGVFTLEKVEQAFIDAGTSRYVPAQDDETLEINKEIRKQTLVNLKKKNELATKELEKMGLQIEQLKSKLVDYEEAYKYLVARKAIHTALLRRILITDVPMTVCGMEFSEARAICEQYYNEIVHSLIETTNLWRRKYAVGNDREFEAEIEKEIRDIINGKPKPNIEESK